LLSCPKQKSPGNTGASFIQDAYLQQSGVVHTVLSHFWPLLQLVQVACLVLAVLTGVLPFAITDAVAMLKASMLTMIFFIFLKF
jgi:hypothetical protein